MNVRYIDIYRERERERGKSTPESLRLKNTIDGRTVSYLKLKHTFDVPVVGIKWGV